jgi:hypothetical protein
MTVYATDDFTPELTTYVLGDSGRDYEIAIEKVGGGTVGHAYEGAWHFLVLGTDDILEMFTGTPKTHDEAAQIAADFMDALREGGE